VQDFASQTLRQIAAVHYEAKKIQVKHTHTLFLHDVFYLLYTFVFVGRKDKYFRTTTATTTTNN
jgi:hypothetical protein